MKKILLLAIVFLAMADLPAQAVIKLKQEPVCWVNNTTETTLLRYTLVSSATTSQPVVFVYRNGQGQAVTPTPGQLFLGACNCCARINPITPPE